MRITVYEDQEAVTLQLEGHLGGPWTRKACVSRMRQEGANFIAPGCLTRSIVEELAERGTGIVRDENEGWWGL